MADDRQRREGGGRRGARRRRRRGDPRRDPDGRPGRGVDRPARHPVPDRGEHRREDRGLGPRRLHPGRHPGREFGDETGSITEKGARALKKVMPQIDPDELRGQAKAEEVITLFTVENLVGHGEDACRRRSAADPTASESASTLVGVDRDGNGCVERRPRSRQERAVHGGASSPTADGKRRRYEHLAARFAAKEAVLKAFGTGSASACAGPRSRCVNERSGRPRIVLARRGGRLRTPAHGLESARRLALAHRGPRVRTRGRRCWTPGGASALPPDRPRRGVRAGAARSGRARSRRSARTTGRTPDGGLRMPPPFVLEAFCQAGTWLIMITTERRQARRAAPVGSVDCIGDVRPGDVLSSRARRVDGRRESRCSRAR